MPRRDRAAPVLSESTVKTHVGRVLAKIGARDRVHAVIIAHRGGSAAQRLSGSAR
ncbi:LuxR C-terminal-related transcriptional regulator [Microbacterium kribbense]|uniref:LuxR C-terminal-related transcriptional regulator n=1 Tax=Microbacterium kribbense TaxID=433645 RepID=UPI003CD0C09C